MLSDAHYLREAEWYETLLTQKSKQIVELQAEIERLKDGEARLRAALRMLYDEMDGYQSINNLSAYNNLVMRKARAALEERT